MVLVISCIIYNKDFGCSCIMIRQGDAPVARCDVDKRTKKIRKPEAKLYDLD